MSARSDAPKPGGGLDARRDGASGEATAPMTAEEALAAQREDLQIILDSVPAFIWYKDGSNRILRANRAAAESMGVSVEALVGRSTHDIYPDEASDYHRDDLEVIRSGRPKLGIVEPLQSGSGEKRWVRTDKIPYRDRNGEIIGVIVFAVDITDAVVAHEALERAHDELEARVEERTAQLAAAVEKLRSEIVERERADERARQHQSTLAHVLRLHTVDGMATQLAHEINQPLAAIANFANGLAARLPGSAADGSDVRAVAEEIGDQALRAGEIIKRLRQFLRKDAPTRGLTDLKRVIHDAVHLVAADARRLGVALDLDLEPGLPPVVIDPIQIEQVVLNLLHNGLEAISAARRDVREIAVEADRPSEAHVEVRIRDSGGTFEGDDAKRAFEAFFTTKKNGLGMGLPISRSIVESHGGRSACRSPQAPETNEHRPLQVRAQRDAARAAERAAELVLCRGRA
jgi:PAS domain S-box-containing protein